MFIDGHYCFSIAAITNYSKFSGMKQLSFIIPQCGRSEVHVDSAWFSATGFPVLKFRNGMARAQMKGFWKTVHFQVHCMAEFLFPCSCRTEVSVLLLPVS